jgi:hypothetical protein
MNRPHVMFGTGIDGVRCRLPNGDNHFSRHKFSAMVIAERAALRGCPSVALLLK